MKNKILIISYILLFLILTINSANAQQEFAWDMSVFNPKNYTTFIVGENITFTAGIYSPSNDYINGQMILYYEDIYGENHTLYSQYYNNNRTYELLNITINSSYIYPPSTYKWFVRYIHYTFPLDWNSPKTTFIIVPQNEIYFNYSSFLPKLDKIEKVYKNNEPREITFKAVLGSSGITINGNLCIYWCIGNSCPSTNYECTSVYDSTPPYYAEFQITKYPYQYNLNVNSTYNWRAKYTHYNGTEYHSYIGVWNYSEFSEIPLSFNFEDVYPQNNYEVYNTSSITFNVKIVPNQISLPLYGNFCIVYDAYVDPNKKICCSPLYNITYPQTYECSITLNPPYSNYNITIGTHYWYGEFTYINNTKYFTQTRTWILKQYIPPYVPPPPSNQSETYLLPLNMTGLLPSLSIYFADLFNSDIQVGLIITALIFIVVSSVLISINLDTTAGLIMTLFGFLVFIRLQYFPFIFAVIFLICSGLVFVYIMRKIFSGEL